MPRQGDAKSYDQAVADFNVEAFAEQIKQTGAGFVVLTTSHAYMYFPAPLASLDKILPGRTASRDLVADLADALGRRNIKLMLYYHLGASDDGEWLNASGFWKTDTSEFFGNWQRVIVEVGERYKTKLAGWWFDDGSTSYYYRSAPWEKLARAAKAGYPGRLVGFNAWELNNPTEFHDFFTGEGFQDPRGFNQLLVKGGNGRYPSGTHQGLQASACLTAEGNWVHTQKDSPAGSPRWNAEQLSALLKEFVAYRNVPIFNMEIYQEGIVSDETIELFRDASGLLEPEENGSQPSRPGKPRAVSRVSDGSSAAFEADLPPAGQLLPVTAVEERGAIQGPGNGTNADPIHNGTTRNGSGNAETLDDGKTFRGYGYGNSVTFRLDVAKRPQGYDLEEIRSFAGHNDARAGQSYSVWISSAAEPKKFVKVATASVACVGGSSQMRVPVKASGVAAVRLDFADGPSGFNVYREICLVAPAGKGAMGALMQPKTGQ
jgi:hypothetical protein